jgi:hypothetical protein
VPRNISAIFVLKKEIFFLISSEYPKATTNAKENIISGAAYLGKIKVLRIGK